jgi:hypothetical protein
MFYRVACRSSGIYGAEGWDWSDTSLYQMETVQNRALRYMCGATYRGRRANQSLRGKTGVPTVRAYVTGMRLKWWGHLATSKAASQGANAILFGHGGGRHVNGSKQSARATKDFLDWKEAMAAGPKWEELLPQGGRSVAARKSKEARVRRAQRTQLPEEVTEEAMGPLFKGKEQWADLTRAVWSPICPQDAKAHAWRHTPEEEKVFQCVVCSKRIRSEQGLKIHLARTHRPRVEVEKTPAVAKSKAADNTGLRLLLKQQRARHPVQTNECPTCHKVFKAVRGARDHWNKVCGKESSSASRQQGIERWLQETPAQ